MDKFIQKFKQIKSLNKTSGSFYKPATIVIGSPEQLQKSVSPTSSTEKSLERIKKNINIEINTMNNFKSSRRKPTDHVFSSRNDSKQIKTHLLPDLQF